ncbi:MAG: hypothetical protein AB2A00_06650 [Myxococcota bacterium]
MSMAMRAVCMMGLCAVVACSSSKSAQGGGSAGDVSARAARVDMKDAAFTGATAYVVLVVDNQGGKDVEIQGASVEVAYEGEGAPEGLGPFKGAMQPARRSVAPAGGSAEVPVEIALEYPTGEAFLAFTKLDVAKLKVTGEVATSAGKIPVDGVTDFPTPKLLEGQVKDAQMSSIDGGAAGEVELDLVLYNPNAFIVKADSWDIKVVIAGKELKTEKLAQGENIQPQAGVGYSQGFKIDQQNWGADYKDVLKLSEVPYEVTGSISVGGVTYPSSISGKMKFHR